MPLGPLTGECPGGPQLVRGRAAIYGRGGGAPVGAVLIALLILWPDLPAPGVLV